MNPETTHRPARHQATRSLHLTLWIAQVVLAISFAMAGWLKATYAPPELVMYVSWSADVPLLLVRLIGIAELSGAAGLVLPGLTRVKPGLTWVAAALLAAVMVLAAGFHLARGETGATYMPLVLALLAGFVAWGRRVRAPLRPRGA